MSEAGEGEKPQQTLTSQTSSPKESGGLQTERATEQLPAPFTKELDEKLFGRLSQTPSGEDPAFWPVRVLNELNYLILDRGPGNSGPIGEKFAPLKETVQNVTTAYEILAYPHCKYIGSREIIEEQLRMKQRREIEAVELNDAEFSVLRKLAAARKIPINPEKRRYNFSEVFNPPHEIEKALSAPEFGKWLSANRKNSDKK